MSGHEKHIEELQRRHQEAVVKQRQRRREEAERQLNTKPNAKSRSLTFIACSLCIRYGPSKGVKSCLQRRDRFCDHLRSQHGIKDVDNLSMGKFEFDFTGHSQSEFEIQQPPLPAMSPHDSNSAKSSSMNYEHMSEDQFEISPTDQATSEADHWLHDQVSKFSLSIDYRTVILNLRFLTLNLGPDCVAISRNIARYGFN